MTTDLRALLPSDKHQTERAEALVRLGYPAIESVLPDVLTWMQDLNWPVAKVFQPFLASIGTGLAPLVRDVLEGEDNVWKYWLVSSVVRESPSLSAALLPELRRMAEDPSDGEQTEGVSEAARELLGLPAANGDA